MADPGVDVPYEHSVELEMVCSDPRGTFRGEPGRGRLARAYGVKSARG